MSSEGIFNAPAIQSLRLAMDESALRQQAISSNIANINTPGYQRLDVSASFQHAFTTAMERLGKGESVGEMPEKAITVAQDQSPARPDGNTVQMEQEMVSMTQNSARFEFAGQMLATNYHQLKYAITGQGA